jgi:hypothetical protein
MTSFDAALLLLGQLPKYLAEMLAKVATKHLPAALGDKNNVVLALPLRVATRPSGFSLKCAWLGS